MTAWTEKEEARLRRLFPDKPTQEIADALGRTYSATAQKARKMGLRKSEAYLSSEAARRFTAEDAVKNRFQKGMTPWNKGKKGWQAGGRARETQFKKGERHGAAARNLLPIGHERLTKDGILERKVAETGVKARDWRSVHVLIWEERNGPLPDGHVVVFKNGNRADLRPDNLEAITRAELAKRNSIWNRYPREVAEVIHLRGVLNRKINDRERRHEEPN